MGPGFQFFQLSHAFFSTCFSSEHVAALSNAPVFPGSWDLKETA